MIIYLDYIFLENFLIDYILIKETSYISRKKILNRNAIISSIIASVYIVVMVYFKIEELNYLICKVFLMFIIIYISFRPKKINEYIKIITLFILISVINVGTATVITNLTNFENDKELLKIIIYVLSLCISKFFVMHMWKVYRQNIKNQDLVYRVKICLNGKNYIYKAFLDTGNSVFSYEHNVPVIFAEIIDESMVDQLKTKESFYIKTVTLSNERYKKAYIFDKIEIKNKDAVWLVKSAVVFERGKLSKDSSYNMLINYNLYVQELGGIKI